MRSTWEVMEEDGRRRPYRKKRKKKSPVTKPRLPFFKQLHTPMQYVVFNK